MFISLQKLEPKEVLDGFEARFIHTDNLTHVYWHVKAGSVLPIHEHPHEQSSLMIEGEFELTIEGQSQICKPGHLAVIPSNAKHGGVALSNCIIMDTFYPVREEYK